MITNHSGVIIVTAMGLLQGKVISQSGQWSMTSIMVYTWRQYYIRRQVFVTNTSALLRILKPHSARTGTVLIIFGCSLASKSKRRCNLCDLRVVQVRYCTVCSGISSYCVLAYPLQQCRILYLLNCWRVWSLEQMQNCQ